MERKVPFVVGEYYHAFTRGVDKMVVCKNDADLMRLQLLLYICNNTATINMRKLLAAYKGEPFVKLFEHPREDTLTEIAAYTLMPNHFHLLLREKRESGISHFMLKLMTAYSMYFNTKYDRSGPLFTRPFRSRHVGDDAYMRWLFSYIHTNAPDLPNYRYSSFPDYFLAPRPESNIVETTVYRPEDIRTMDERLAPFATYKGEPFA